MYNKIMKKYTITFTILCILISILMLCSCGQNADVQSSKMIGDAGPVQAFFTESPASVSAVIDKAGAMITAAEKEKALLLEKSMELYEAYLDTLTNNDYLSAYYDYDDDGITELYVRRNEPNDSYGEILQYRNGGLTDVEHGIVPDEYINSLDWTATFDASQDIDEYEWGQEGFHAYITDEPYITLEFWYPDKDAFLLQYGFSGTVPFYTYSLPDNTSWLTLYYDEQAQFGCGVLYRTWTLYTSEVVSAEYGFTFHGPEAKPESWEDNLQVDYMKLESVDGGTASESPEYKEHIEYDESGRVTHYESSGILDYMGDDLDPETLLQIDFIYDENGTLIERDYHHNGNAFGTGYSTWNSYFDNLGRLEYEYIYITHGGWYYYYIYTDESDMPAYCLHLDDNGGYWIADFIEY